jgi:hypothetical protein
LDHGGGFFRAGIKCGTVMEASGFGKKNGVRLPFPRGKQKTGADRSGAGFW